MTPVYRDQDGTVYVPCTMREIVEMVLTIAALDFIALALVAAAWG